MGNKNIKKEAKKPKQSDKKPLASITRTTPGETTAQPALIEKVRKPK